ncbi:MAG: M28 family peptidase, partial [Ignavibacteriales bacterium]|nr:M28 family peptidase [Ignavibacteriales bacterium]
KPKRTIIFALWTGEEKGLLGSRYYVQSLKDDVDKVVAYLNYDMISRDSEDDSLGVECSMTYTKAFSKFEEMTKSNIKNNDLKLDVNYRPSENPRGGSDHTPFAEKDVPIFYFMAGFHTEYHTPVDEVDKVNYNKMAEIIKVGFLNIWEIANMPENFRSLKQYN